MTIATWFKIAYILGVVASSAMIYGLSKHLIPATVASCREKGESIISKALYIITDVVFAFMALFIGVTSVWKLVAL